MFWIDMIILILFFWIMIISILDYILDGYSHLDHIHLDQDHLDSIVDDILDGCDHLDQ